MARAEICPVCDGEGYALNRAKLRMLCHGCDGKGWVEVGKCDDCPYAGLIASHQYSADDMQAADGAEVTTNANPRRYTVWTGATHYEI